MKRIINIALLILLCLPASAQLQCKVYSGDTVNCVDSAGLRQGRWINLDHRGKYILDEGMYVDGKKEGVWNDYYPNGRLKFTVTFKNGVPSGEAASYYATGQLSEKGNWGKYGWVGEYTVYYVNGCVLSKTIFDKEGYRLKAMYFSRDSCGMVALHPGRVKRSYKWLLPRRMAYEAEARTKEFQQDQATKKGYFKHPPGEGKRLPASGNSAPHNFRIEPF